MTGTIDPPRYRHRKRGTVYRILHLGGTPRLQLDGIHDMDEMVVYQDISSGAIFVRLKTEFFDGRFEELRDGAGE